MTDNAAELRRWAETHRDDTSTILAAVARHTLAHLPKTPTLADELRAPLGYNQEGIKHVAFSVGEVNRLADRAEQIEQERDDLARARESQEKALHEHGRLLSEARAEVERLTAERDEITADRDRLAASNYILGAKAGAATVAREENVAADQQANPKGTLASSLPDPADVKTGDDWLAGVKEAVRYTISATLPDPADVKPGEAWIVEVEGRFWTGLKDYDDEAPWTLARQDALITCVHNCEMDRLISRLVPAPRVITHVEELDALAEGAVIFSVDAQYALQHGDDGEGWYGTASARKATSFEALGHGPVTVLWEPGA